MEIEGFTCFPAENCLLGEHGNPKNAIAASGGRTDTQVLGQQAELKQDY